MADQRPPRLAVLIDADNTSYQLVNDLFEEIAKLGVASVRRIYGDFTKPHLKNWHDVLPRHAILPYHAPANTTGKNASDIALVIDAMDLLHDDRMEGFCLVSSDSDFTRLASRLREQGVLVYGIGERKTPESFRQACHRFIFTENLGVAEGAAPEVPAPAKKLGPEDAAPLLRKTIEQMNVADGLDIDDGWVGLGQFGKYLSQLKSDFDPRSYGHGKLIHLVEQSGAFEIRRNQGGHPEIRLKPEAKAEGAAPKRRRRPRRAPADPA